MKLPTSSFITCLVLLSHYFKTLQEEKLCPETVAGGIEKNRLNLLTLTTIVDFKSRMKFTKLCLLVSLFLEWPEQHRRYMYRALTLFCGECLDLSHFNAAYHALF